MAENNDIFYNGNNGCGVNLAGADNARIAGNTITANQGIILSSDNTTVTDNIISAYSNNTNARFAVTVNNPGHVISSNEVRGYRNSSSGNAALVLQGPCDVYSNTLVDNVVGMLVRNNVTIKNNIIANQPRLDADWTANSIGITREAGTATVSYNNVWKVDTAYGGTLTLSNNISAFPGFVSPESHDYRLQTSNAYWTNPCVGTGDGGVNIGAYDPVDLSIPYRTTSYLSGSGSDGADGATISTPWRTLARANQYTVHNINLAAGTYTAAGPTGVLPMYLSLDRYLKGADRDAVTIEAGTGPALGIIMVNDNSSIEGVTIDPNGVTLTAALNVIGQGGIIKDNLINCQGVNEGGIYSVGGADYLTIEGNVIWQTTTAVDRDSIDLNSSDNIHIARNELRLHDRGIIIDDCLGTNIVNRNTVVKSDRCGLYASNSSVTATNNIFASEVGGFSGTSPRGIETVIGGSVNSSYNCFYANTTDYIGTVTNKTADLVSDPVFVDAVNNDYYLHETSPCIDSGTPAGTERGAYDYVPPGQVPTVTVLSPNGGETITGETASNITWTATSPISLATDPISIWYSTDSGANWTSIVSGIANSGSYGWSVPDINSSTARIRIEAVDYWGRVGTGESAADFSITKSTTGDATAPSVSIQVNNAPLGTGDPISGKPRIVGVISDDDSFPKDGRMYIDGVEIPTADLIREFPTSGNGQVLHLIYQPETELAAGEHSIRVEGWDYAGNIGTAEAGELQVAAPAESAALTEAPLVSSPVFAPAPDGSVEMTIAFTLNKDVPTQIFMVGMGGEAVWSRQFAAGEIGAVAGYNVVTFNGISDVTGAPLGNGIYVYQIVANGKVIGKGHIVIFE
ncbi:NosD domain-containing protein [Candidatus Margulisiibacteriota bacterium]